MKRYLLSGIVVILLIAVIAYFHYVQGMLSGVLSAVCAVIAALLAFSYHEQVIEYMQGKIPDQATSLILVAMFLVLLVSAASLASAATIIKAVKSYPAPEKPSPR